MDAAAIIDALNARATPSSRLRDAAAASWGSWLARLGDRPGRVTGAAAEAIVADLAARPLSRPAARASRLTRWQAFATLWRQQWQPPAREDRTLRWMAGGVSLVWHVLLVIAFIWVTALQFLGPPRGADEEAVLVEFLGEGTPDEQGGGLPPSSAASEEAAASTAPEAAPQGGAAVQAEPSLPALAVPAPPPPDLVAPVPDVALRPVPEPVPAQQRVTVSTPISPEPPVFELPPTTPPQVDLSAPRVAQVPPVRVVAVPEPVRAPPSVIMPSTVGVEPLRRPVPDVAQREVPEPVRMPSMRAPVVTIDAPPIRAPVPEVRQRAVPAPVTGAREASAATPPADAATRASASATPLPGDQAPRRSGPAPAARAPGTSQGLGTGPASWPAPGALSSPRRGDDWGDADRNRPGAGNGLLGADGRPRLADTPGSASAGRPPGSATEEIADLDRAGTWLKRKPIGYEPTSFDRYWRPNETLLAEWVRRGIKEVSIPVPGSKHRIVCTVSMLQFGGGCMLRNPDANEQPAGARPPPDIPFKPHLQEGNGALPPTGEAAGAGAASGL